MAIHAVFSKVFNWIKSCVINSEEKDPKGKSKETLSFKTNFQTDPTIESVLQDFEKLNFENSNKCFDEIVDSYQKKGKIDLFNSVILNKRKEIIDILDYNLADLKKTDSQAYFERQEEFRKQYGRHILKVDKAMHYGKKLQNRLQVFKDQAEEVLLDFKKLKLNLVSDNCTDSSDSINYNPHGSQDANPFDKIANYYRYEKDVFLFNYVILTKRKEIMEILDSNNVDEATKERFKVRFGRYLLRIEEGMDYAKEFLSKGDLMGYFDGCYWPNTKTGRRVNHYDHLMINIKPEENLEISCLFSEKTKRMEIIKHEVEKVMICSNGKRIATVEKNEKQQRNYCFEEDAICEMEIKWNAENEEDEFVNCSIILNINSDQFEIEKATVNGEIVELKKILELTKQNKEVLMEGKDLHKFLEGYLEKDYMQSQKGEVIIPKATVPSFSFSFDSLKPGELQAGCIGGGYDLKYLSRPSTRLDRSSVDKFDPDYREWDR